MAKTVHNDAPNTAERIPLVIMRPVSVMTDVLQAGMVRFVTKVNCL